MQRAEGSSNTVGAEGSSNTFGGRQRKRQLRPSRAPISYHQSINRLSVEGRRTHMIVNRTRKRLLNTIIGAYSTVFDNTSAPYRWLRSGWLVEERRMVRHGRIYRVMPFGLMWPRINILYINEMIVV